MESGNTIFDMNMLINVLMQGDEHVRELQAWLDQPCSAEACKMLASKVESAFATAISMARLIEQEISRPLLADDSPHSGSSEKVFKELERKQMCKKRKTLPRWSSQVRACSSSSMEGPLDDGHSWRKYGQKDILGAKFPRGYYRCTYRHSHGCLATKQVQRSDDDSSVFDVTYRGAHTCNHNLQRNPLPSPKELHMLQQNQSPTQQQLLQIFKTGLRVKTEGLSSYDQPLNSTPSFAFPSKSTPASCMKPDSNVFMGNYSPTFVSTTTSTESNYFSMSPCGVDNYGGIQNIQSFDSEIAEIISAATATSPTSSPLVGVNFPLEQIGFDAEFPFDFS